MAIVDRLIAHPETRYYMGKTQIGFDAIQKAMRTRLIDQEDPAHVLLTSPEQFFLDQLHEDVAEYNAQHGQTSIGFGIVIVGSMARAAVGEPVTPGDVDVRLTSDLDLRDKEARDYWKGLNRHIGHRLTYRAGKTGEVITGIYQPQPTRYFASLPLRGSACRNTAEQVRYKIMLTPDDNRPDIAQRNVDLLLSSEHALLTTTELLQKESWKDVYPHCVLITE